MKLNYEFTENEFLALKKDYAFNSKLFKRYKFMGTLILPLVLLVMIIFQFIIGELDIPLLIISGFIAVAWMLGYPKYFEKTVINKSKKLLREGNNSALIGPHEIILDEHEIVNRTPGSEIKTRWESFVKLTETAEHMFLYTTNFSAIVIPKEKAVADTVKEQIFEFIRNKIKK